MTDSLNHVDKVEISKPKPASGDLRLCSLPRSAKHSGSLNYPTPARTRAGIIANTGPGKDNAASMSELCHQLPFPTVPRGARGLKVTLAALQEVNITQERVKTMVPVHNLSNFAGHTKPKDAH